VIPGRDPHYHRVCSSPETGEVRVYDRNGSLLSGFPFQLLLDRELSRHRRHRPRRAQRDTRHQQLLAGLPGLLQQGLGYDLAAQPRPDRVGQFAAAPNTGASTPGRHRCGRPDRPRRRPTPLGQARRSPPPPAWAAAWPTPGPWRRHPGHRRRAHHTYAASHLHRRGHRRQQRRPADGHRGGHDHRDPHRRPSRGERRPHCAGRPRHPHRDLTPQQRDLHWDLGDGANGTGRTLTHTYP